MASLRMKEREKKRQKQVAKYAAKRDKLRAVMKSVDATSEQKMEAQVQLQKLPRDSSKSRLRNRCWKTGRGNGVYRTFGLCRNMLRQLAMRGDIPGLQKASW